MSESQRLLPAVVVFLVALVMLCFGLYIHEVIKSTPTSKGVTMNLEGGGGGPQQVFRWNLVTTWPKNFPGLGTAPELFAKNVNEMSNGRLQIKVHGAGELVPALGVFDAVSSGSVEMGHGAAYYWKGKFPAAVLFTTIPFGMNAQETNGWITHGGGMALWREAYAPFNLVPFPGGNTGVQMAGWFNKKINSLDDIKGLKMRIPGMGGEVWSRAGGVAINIPGGELYTSLQTGVIDATEWVGPYNDLAMGFYQVAKYYYYPGWHEPGSMLEFIVNQDAYNTLPPDLQKIVEISAVAANQLMLDQYTNANNAALKELVDVYGVELLPLPDAVLDKLKAISLQIYKEMSANDPQFAKIYESYHSFQEKASGYHRISEEAYYKTRQ
ncbi:TRAP transporter substrate-binding protein DctP [Halioxenophilus sp. WMMB6]|uniref:TRAP transporter substrate-binding protein n=1 Tax=Halioxenophilus sp. WMMB6 TaxID=3073815 RepID=UPI00295E5487|nr:TRAP transporter substrate-binding protein DctP [Halioxenophilus sp. WMMB6]